MSCGPYIESLYYVFLDGEANLMVVCNGCVRRTTNHLNWATGMGFDSVREKLISEGARVDWVRDVETIMP